MQNCTNADVLKQEANNCGMICEMKKDYDNDCTGFSTSLLNNDFCCKIPSSMDRGITDSGGYSNVLGDCYININSPNAPKLTLGDIISLDKATILV